MIDTQSRSMQYVSGIFESVGNPIAQRQGIDSPRSVQRYTKIRSKRCPEVCKVDKLYVGLLRELPPPSPVQGKWDKEVQPDLERHVCQATSMLSKSMRDEEVITELVLCMAGKKCSPTSVSLGPGETCPKDPVALNPTVWICCGSKKCKKKVLEAIRNLTYLNSFLVKFCMEAPYASLQAPWPAAEERPPQSPRLTEKFDNISFAIQDRTSGLKTICGARVRFTIETSNSIVERYSTIGGLIVVENSLFAITSAHAIVNCLLESSHSASSDETESTSNVSSDAGSDCETSSDSGSDVSADSPYSSPARITSTKRPSLEAEKVRETKEGMWTDSQLPEILAYMNRGTIKGDYIFPDPAPSSSDFALVDPRSVVQLSNEYYNPDYDTFATISDHIPTRELLSGDVWIIISCGNAPVKGYMLEGNASVILRGTVMRTKKIQVAVAGDPGLSGAWVVREGKLCGIIYAAYDRSPYLHMLPAEGMFQNIAKLVQASIVRVANAQDIYEYETSKKELGKKHPDTLTSMANLASTYRNQGRWKEAEELEVQVMETRKRVLGPEHPDTLTSMSNLASTFWNQGRWKEAEELEVQVMETSSRVLGSEHPDTLTSMANLASTYRNQGRWKEAEELDAQVMETRKSVLGSEHPDTLTSMANLASTYRNQGRWKEAEELLVQVIATRKRMLGDEHPDTLISMGNLASTYRNQGRWKEAEELLVQVIETSKRVLGDEHPDTLTSMNNLASTYRNQGRWKEAEELLMQVIEASKRVLREDHPDTLTGMNNLASTYRNQGRWKEAEELFMQVIETRKRVLREEHPDTLASINKLALTLKSQSRNKEAIFLIKNCFELQEKILGPQHPYTEASLKTLNKWRMENLQVEL